MEIKELQDEKRKLEREISKLINSFEVRTEVKIKTIKFIRHDFRTTGGMIYGDFELEIEIAI